MLKKKLIGLALLASFGTAGAFAASAPAADAPYTGDVPAVLKQAQQLGGLEVRKSFDAAGGLHGWVVKDRSGKYIVVYTTPDNTVLLAGIAMDVTGRNLSNDYAAQYVPQPDYSAAYKAFTTEASSVLWGNPKAKAEMTIVTDPNCPFCQRLEAMVKQAVDDGKLKVHLVPVGFEAPDSPQKAAGLLKTKDVSAYMTSDVVRGPVEQSTDPELAEKVKANWALMSKYGFNGTPAVFYKSVADAKLNVSPGVPNMTELLTKLGLESYLPALKADPNFARYVR
ncbi:thiol:disulfide interchange protein DsbG [Burkholderia multivorans]|jgi:thiol:disulfide interchange protein DsbG|uniref:thiol:disulfide interchange protein DsbG n=1 Tax=Burkholderia multivorans TaxID=87883 RepID=UPI001C232C95|nr:thiol:disulfide interchange protein DsbG [Burkholderia multivorans]MBU9200071.1 thiol:disulfide interchange protein DsbG [Burkholderia multivorans]MDN8078808.1 thiol:disulfide interchange protein DsbG [Burkholderia multivorans]